MCCSLEIRDPHLAMMKCGHPTSVSARLASAGRHVLGDHAVDEVSGIEHYSDAMVDQTSVIVLVVSIAAWLFGVGLTLLILWAIIRGAVLSALRKHASETQAGPQY